MKSYRRWWRMTALAGAMTLLASACGGGTTAKNTNAAPGGQPPTANMKPQSSIGKGEGQLNLIAWEGYLQPEWVKPFEDKTGCQVHAKYAGSSDEMVTLIRGGGGGQYDMVSASGDADLRLIYGGDVKPVNVKLIPDWQNFFPQFQAPDFNTISGVHYGVSLQWGPNVLLYNTKDYPKAPSSWSTLYDPKNKGQITVPDNPIQIADAALYLSKTKPVPRHQGPIRAHAGPVPSRHQAAQATASSGAQVLGARAAGDLDVQERRRLHRCGVAISNEQSRGCRCPHSRDDP